MAKDAKPGKSGAVRPPVIDLKADEIDTGAEENATGGNNGKGEKSQKPEKPGKVAAGGAGAQGPAAGEKAGKGAQGKPDKAATDKQQAGSAESSGADRSPPAAHKPARPAPKVGAKGGKRPQQSEKPGKPGPGSKAAEEQPAEKRLPPQPRKGAGGVLALAVMVGLGALGVGGYWLYRSGGLSLFAPASRQQEQAAALSALKGELASAQRKAAALKGRLKGLEGAVKALREQNVAMRQKLEKVASAAAVQQVQERIAALEQGTKANSRGLAETAARLNDLAGRFSALSASLEKAAASGEAPSAAVASAAMKAEELRQEVERRMTALQQRLAAVEKALKAGPGASAEDLQALRRQLAEQEKALEALRAEAADGARKAAAALAAVEQLKAHPPKAVIAPPPAGVAYAALRRKAASGAPFAKELKALQPWLPTMMELLGSDEIEKVAAAGAPPRTELEKRLAALAAAHAERRRKALEQERASGLSGALKARLSRLVKVRKADEADWPAALEAARKALQDGSLAAAINILRAQPGKPPQDIAAWIEDARRRMIVDKALSDIGEQVMTVIAGKRSGAAQ